MSGFAENINYIAKLDHTYGTTVELAKSSLVTIDRLVVTINVLNTTTTENTVVIADVSTGFNTILDKVNEVKRILQLAGMTVAVTVNTTMFSDLKFTITAKADTLLYDATMAITSGIIDIPVVKGVVTNTFKTLPILASMNSDIVDVLIRIAPYIEDVQHAKENAIAAKNIAEKWASEATDVIVADGKYSAKHYADKASPVANIVEQITTLAELHNKIELLGTETVLLNIMNVTAPGVLDNIDIVASPTNITNIETIANAAANIDAIIINVLPHMAEILNVDDKASQVTIYAANVAADKIVVNSDKVAVAADRVQTGLDVVTTNANVITTNENAAITTADREQTGLDRIATEASAIAALASQNSAEISATEASTILNQITELLDSFDDRYLGAKAEDPTLDNNSLPILTGALYWDTSTMSLKVYNGTVWTPVVNNNDGLLIVNNLADIQDKLTARTNLGVYSKSESDTKYEPIDSTILKNADIGVTVQAYSVSTVIDSEYVHTDNNYTTVEKNKLAGIDAGAEVNVNADWNAVSGDAQILNKPTTISGYGITDAYTKEEVDDAIATATFTYRDDTDNIEATVSEAFDALNFKWRYTWDKVYKTYRSLYDSFFEGDVIVTPTTLSLNNGAICAIYNYKDERNRFTPSVFPFIYDNNTTSTTYNIEERPLPDGTHLVTLRFLWDGVSYQADGVTPAENAGTYHIDVQTMRSISFADENPINDIIYWFDKKTKLLYNANQEVVNFGVVGMVTVANGEFTVIEPIQMIRDSYNDLADKPTYKTINNESILGEGNIDIVGGDGVALPSLTNNNGKYLTISQDGTLQWADMQFNYSHRQASMGFMNVYPAAGTFAPFCTNFDVNSTISASQKIDNYTFKLRAGKKYKINGGIYAETKTSGVIILDARVYNDASGTTLRAPALSGQVTSYLNASTTGPRLYYINAFYNPTEDCYLKLYVRDRTLSGATYLEFNITIDEIDDDDIVSDTTNLANKNGDQNETFKVANAINEYDAINKAQLDSAISSLQSEQSGGSTSLSGGILQVVHAETISQMSFTGTAHKDVISCSITPKASGSKFLVMVNTIVGAGDWNATEPNFFLKRDNVVFGSALATQYTAEGSFLGFDASVGYTLSGANYYHTQVSRNAISEGSTEGTPINFKLCVNSRTDATVHINRCATIASYGSGVTSITVFEIK